MCDIAKLRIDEIYSFCLASFPHTLFAKRTTGKLPPPTSAIYAAAAHHAPQPASPFIRGSAKVSFRSGKSVGWVSGRRNAGIDGKKVRQSNIRMLSKPGGDPQNEEK